MPWEELPVSGANRGTLREGQHRGLEQACDEALLSPSDLPCYMTTEEMKSLIRLPDIIACAKQSITMAEISAWKGTGLAGVLRWLQDTHRTSS